MKNYDVKSQGRAKALRKNMPKAAVILWQHLRNKQLAGINFRREHPVAPYILDFANVKNRLAIEVDGATHAGEDEMAYDERRTKFLESKGWTVLRFLNTDIYNSLEGVLDTIRNAILSREAGEVAERSEVGGGTLHNA